MKTIGYMEGTNSELLTNLLVDGVDTLPLSNGWDNHGKFIAHISRTDHISAVVGYLQDKAKKLLKGKGVNYIMADPGDLTKVVKATLKQGKVRRTVVKKAKKKAKKTTKRK